MAAGPDLRIGDAEREAAAASLREHYAQGRLTIEEFNVRLDAVFRATTQRQLNMITDDLPRAAAPSASLPVAGLPGGDRERGRDEWSGWRRPRLGVFPAIMAALGTFLLLAGLHMATFPWPGKLGIFLALFGVIRGIMRRVFGIGRRSRVRPYGGCGRARRYPGGPWSGI
jgi:hypothetical protein